MDYGGGTEYAAYTGESMKCDDCGEELLIGDWPWCPHGNVRHFGEDPMEPYSDWQLDAFGDGIEITTRAQRRKVMAEHALEYVEPSKMKQPVGKRLYFDQKG